ncbi:hypothetical protein H5P28_00820 [Ruficoccus amylovorans]|uniref:Uncharacterized protein n=1 Tax=Ruficoccus amylovorans TaxID=1804625 RepID=A0A842H8D9_9BACT|nr:hypothetical protein [Ruficoccus amylovorans]MBC2592793.1 hypothetical protein [Ruficoccus amylovorans]
METITDFIAWLDGAEPEGHDEVYSLYRSVKDCKAWGSYKTVPARGNGDRWIVTADHIDSCNLLLASERAKEAFLLHLERTYCDNDLDMEGWHAFKHAMSKND